MEDSLNDLWSLWFDPVVALALDEGALGTDRSVKAWDLLCDLAWDLELGWWSVRRDYWHIDTREKVYEMVLYMAPTPRPLIPAIGFQSPASPLRPVTLGDLGLEWGDVVSTDWIPPAHVYSSLQVDQLLEETNAQRREAYTAAIMRAFNALLDDLLVIMELASFPPF
jgi:hypothetical protein